MNLGEKIAALIEEKHVTKVDLAKDIGVKDSSAISNWTKGRSKPEWANIKALAEYFGKPESYFTDDQSPVRGNMTVIEVNIVGVAGADVFAFNFDDPPLEQITVPVRGNPSHRYAAFRVRGDCMEDRYHDGEVVIVVESANIPDGKPGVFRLDSGCTLKIPRHRNGTMELCPINPKYPSIPVKTNKMTMVGVVVGVWREP